MYTLMCDQFNYILLVVILKWGNDVQQLLK